LLCDIKNNTMASISNILQSASQALGKARMALATSLLNAIAAAQIPPRAVQEANAARVFSEENMRAYVGKEIPGANDPKLNGLLEGLLSI